MKEVSAEFETIGHMVDKLSEADYFFYELHK